MKTINNISKVGIDERAKLLKALNRVSETLEADSDLKEEMKKMVESYNTTSDNLSGMVTEMLQEFKGMSSSTFSGNASIPTAPLPEVHASIGGEFRETDEAAETPMKQEPKRPTRVVPISTIKPITRPNPEVALIESASRLPLTNLILEIHVPQQIVLVIDITLPEPQVTQREGKGIATDEQPKSPPKLVPASKEVYPDNDALILMPYEINGKNSNLLRRKYKPIWTKRKGSRKRLKKLSY
ncbi:hypothetical protein Tco_1138348 [Tanacetum coccineum]